MKIALFIATIGGFAYHFGFIIDRIGGDYIAVPAVVAAIVATIATTKGF